jgi:biopolymer transport protein ExbD
MKHIIIIVLAIACCIGTQGCSTSSKRAPSSLRVYVLEDGSFNVSGRVTALSGLGKAVKAAGARPTTSIKVAVPDTASQGEMTRIIAVLRRAGYVRVLFTRPRRAHAS